MRWITAVFLIGLITGTHAGMHKIEGRVVGITDGDTLTLLDVDKRQHKIRLDGSDAPESRHAFVHESKLHPHLRMHSGIAVELSAGVLITQLSNLLPQDQRG